MMNHESVHYQDNEIIRASATSVKAVTIYPQSLVRLSTIYTFWLCYKDLIIVIIINIMGPC